MITAISILLYFAAAFFAMATGVLAQQNKTDSGIFGLIMFVSMFVMAASLQVFA